MSSRVDHIISLIFATRKMMHEQKESCRGRNCSFLHLISLGYIQQKSPLMKEIADFLGVAPPSATSLVGTLIKSELVHREADADDRRNVRIVISKKGEKFLEGHKENMAEKMRKNLSKLSATEQQQLEKILEKISA
ncbi:MAG: MarR family transcriptional regulator [Candidatus Moranbacteria bacterium]|nr:MarR family transcriptional regulator [Candidatus Moranbacteria bacterium]